MNRIRNCGILCLTLIFILSCSKDPDPTPPEASILSLPTNGENCISGKSVNENESTVQFSWTNNSDVSYFMLEILNLETEQNTVARVIPSNDSENSSVLTTKNLVKGFPYEWYVTSHSDEFPDQTPKSSKWRFYLQGDAETNSPPFPAQLIYPSPGEAVLLDNDNLLNLNWEGVDPENDTLTYTLFLDIIDGMQPPLEQYENLGSTNLFVSLQKNTVYYWRIFSEDSVGNNSISQVQSFILIL